MAPSVTGRDADGRSPPASDKTVSPADELWPAEASASAASAVKGKIRVASLERLPVASTSTVLRGCTQVNQQVARTKVVSVEIEKGVD